MMKRIRDILTGKSKAFRSFLFSYSIFLLIIVCIGILSIRISADVIQQQIGEIYTASVDQVRAVTYGYISSAAKTASELKFSNRVKALQMAGNCDTPQDLLTLTALQTDIRNTIVVNPAISRAAVYFPSGDFVIDNTSCFRTNMLDQWGRVNYYRSFAELRQFALNEYTIGKVLTLVNPDTGATDLLYVKTLGDYPVVSPLPVLLITLKGSALSSPLSDLERAIGAPVQIVLDDGLTLDSSFRMIDERSALPANADLRNREGGAYPGDNGDFVICRPSGVMKATLVCSVPKSQYMSRVFGVIRILVGLLTGFLVVGVGLAFFFSGRSYTPLEKMMRLLGSSGTSANEGAVRQGEYAYIEQCLRDIISENRLLERNLDRQRQEMRESFLVRLVKGSVPLSALQGTLEYYNVDLSGDRVIAAAFSIEDHGSHFAERDGKESLDLLKYSIRNTAEELMRGKCGCFTCEAEQGIVCVAGGETGAALFEETLNAARTVVDFFAKKLSVRLAASVSGTYEGIASIPQAYRECMEGLEYRTAAGITDSVYYRKTDSGDSPEAFGYSSHVEHLFINCIKSGEYQRAKDYLGTLIEHCRSIRSLQLMKVKMAGLVSAVLSALAEIGAGSDAQYLADMDPAKRLLDARSIDALEAEIRLILDRIVEHTKEQRTEMDLSSVEEMTEYLRAHFTDPQMSISGLSEHFGLSRSYLSQKFKAGVGMSPLEYLNKLRIEKAKELVRNGAANFAEVAAACGYYDNHALNVAFKKYEGVPPSKYRSMLAAEPLRKEA